MPVANDKNLTTEEKKAAAFINDAHKFYVAHFCKTPAEGSSAKDSPKFIAFLERYKMACDAYLAKGYEANAIPSHLNGADFTQKQFLTPSDSAPALLPSERPPSRGPGRHGV